MKQVRATGFNHVSISVDNLEEAVRFYSEILGMEKIPTFNLASPAQFLRVGDLQLHLVQRRVPAPEYHHFALNVDNFEAIYLKAEELNLWDDKGLFPHLREMPDGAVQMYIRDPSGNLIEIDWPDITTLDRSIIPEIKKLSDTVPQTPETRGATLYLQL